MEGRLIRLVKGTHPNELSAAAIADDVFLELRQRGAICSIETVPPEWTIDMIFSLLDGRKRVSRKLAESVERTCPVKIDHGEGDEPKEMIQTALWSLDGQYETALAGKELPVPSDLYSFHNYCVEPKGLEEARCEHFKSYAPEAGLLGKFRFYGEDPPEELHGEIACFTMGDKVRYVEIPAVYHVRPAYSIPSLKGDASYEQYLFRVDQRRTERCGLYSPELARTIAEGIIEQALAEK